MNKGYVCCLIFSVVVTAMVSSNAHALGWFGETIDGVPCQGNGQSFGPFDYLEVISTTDRNLINSARLWEVDTIHYGRGVRYMESGIDNISLERAWHEFDYTLRAFPNHALALRDLIQLEIERLNTNKRTNQSLPPLRTPPECYLQRAEVFRPDQEHIPLLYGIYYYRLGKYKEAEIQYNRAISINPNNPESHYNLGLLLMRLGRYQEALEHAREAYALNYPLDALKQQLISAGVWTDTNGEAHPK